MTRPTASHPRAESDALTIDVPLTFKKRGGRKQMIMPDGNAMPVRPSQQTLDSGSNATLIRALARAHRWKVLLESGSYWSITELAEAEGVNRSYLCRMLRLTLLAPKITNEILDGRADELLLGSLIQPFAAEWDQQRPPSNLVQDSA
jgi:hypothetical protein